MPPPHPRCNHPFRHPLLSTLTLLAIAHRPSATAGRELIYPSLPPPFDFASSGCNKFTSATRRLRPFLQIFPPVFSDPTPIFLRPEKSRESIERKYRSAEGKYGDVATGAARDRHLSLSLPLSPLVRCMSSYGFAEKLFVA